MYIKCFSQVSIINATLYEQTLRAWQLSEIGWGHRHLPHVSTPSYVVFYLCRSSSSCLIPAHTEDILIIRPRTETLQYWHMQCKVNSFVFAMQRLDCEPPLSNRHGCASLAPEPHCFTDGENPALFTKLLFWRFRILPAEWEVCAPCQRWRYQTANLTNKVQLWDTCSLLKFLHLLYLTTAYCREGCHLSLGGIESLFWKYWWLQRNKREWNGAIGVIWFVFDSLGVRLNIVHAAHSEQLMVRRHQSNSQHRSQNDSIIRPQPASQGLEKWIKFYV